LVRIYLVTDRSAISDLPGALAAALSVLPIGTAAVQLREKDLSPAELLELARTLLPLCRSAKAPFLVNTRLEVVKAARADGVHLPADGPAIAEARRQLGPGALIGRSCHSPAEVASAARDGAEGMTALHEATKAASLPVFAIGGVTPPRAKRAVNAGAHGVACIRGILGAPNPATAALDMWKAISG